MTTEASAAQAEATASSARERALVEVDPHRWALQFWARWYRRLARRWTVDSHIKKLCQPFTVEGREILERAESPMIIIANHTSHFDTAVVLHLLPSKIYDRTAVVAAADRMYRDRLKGMWNSLRYNSFPITRGGGREALAYTQWLMHHGWSILIFPEGKRSRNGELMPFHGGPAILALAHNVPVLQIYIKGAMDILPPGTRHARPAPVHARVGEPFTIAPGSHIGDAKHQMEEAMRALANGDSVQRAA